MVHYSQHLPMSTSSVINATSPPTSSPSDEWCALPENAFFRVCFKSLCMIAISQSSVEHWEVLRQNSLRQNSEELERNSTEPKRNLTEEKWEKHKKMVINRFENMNITAGLVLTSSAVFISTNPPIQSLIPYANQVSYILQVISFVAALMSLMTGTSVLIIYDTCYAHKDILQSFKESRLRLIICLVLMAFPTLALIVSTLTLIHIYCRLHIEQTLRESPDWIILRNTCSPRRARNIRIQRSYKKGCS
ncbi:hypothetical protein BDR03DRAFT_444640 [Suillus americanus]|nr:hypothetical protein BDR03DRAFT_444640 [Suillus americanus]